MKNCLDIKVTFQVSLCLASLRLKREFYRKNTTEKSFPVNAGCILFQLHISSIASLFLCFSVATCSLIQLLSLGKCYFFTLSNLSKLLFFPLHSAKQLKWKIFCEKIYRTEERIKKAENNFTCFKSLVIREQLCWLQRLFVWNWKGRW